MSVGASNINRKKYITDLLIIGLSGMAILVFIGIFYLVLKIDMEKWPLFLQLLSGAFMEYGLMGLGISIVCFIRRESFASFGLKKRKFILTLALSVLPCLPELINTIIKKGGVTYFPFQGVNLTKPVLASGFPVNIIGMVLIIVVWGFFEGFTYAVIYDRINKLLPAKNLFLNYGAIICGVFCLAIHIALGHSYSLIDALCTFSLIYGMLVVYKYTGNAWGCVFIYFFYWNAIA
jgi:hypothetical protein